MESIYVSVAFANLFIGFLVGGTGIGGFLLPVMLTGLLAFPVRSALSLSFIAFTVAGLAGSYYFFKANSLDIRKALILSLGSMPGAWVGVLLNKLMPNKVVSLILYSFILASSVYTLWSLKKRSSQTHNQSTKASLYVTAPNLLVIGFLTAAFCSFAGVGGPIMVIPILGLLGIPSKQCVGIALLNSVFIGLIAALGYSMEMGKNLIIFGSIETIAVVIGAMAGAKVFHGMEARRFSMIVAIVAGISSLFLLFSGFFK